jgi:hypothetical protein
MGTEVTGGCLSEFRLDKLMANELDVAAAASARAHVDGCGDCAARLAALTADRDRFRADLAAKSPPPAARPAIAARRRRRLHRAALPALGLAAAAAAAFLLWPRRVVDDGPPSTETVARQSGVRRKGGLALRFYVRRDGGVTAGASGDVLAPGDEVRFSISSDRPGYLVVGSVDAGGHVTIFVPEATATRAAPVDAGSDRLLAGAFALDDTLGPELVIAFLCAEPIAVADARAALAATAPALPGCQVDRIEWTKRAR